MVDEPKSRGDALQKILELAHGLWLSGRFSTEDRNAITAICKRDAVRFEFELPRSLYRFAVQAAARLHVTPAEFVRGLIREEERRRVDRMLDKRGRIENPPKAGEPPKDEHDG